MDALCITSDRPGAGKTALAAALVAGMVAAGRKVTYLRVPNRRDAGHADTAFVREAVLGLRGGGEGPESTRLALGGEEGQGPLYEQLGAAMESAVAQGMKLVVEAPSLDAADDGDLEVCRRVVKEMNGGVVVVVGYAPGVGGDGLQAVLRPLQPQGFLVNGVPLFRAREVRQYAGELAQENSPRLLGVVPEDRTMLAATVGQLAQHLDARWVTGEEKAGHLVRHILIGGNIMDWGAIYFGRHEDKAVVVRGDRPDIHLAALSTPTACLVLTGGHQPIPYVYKEAEQREVPLLVVDRDTVSTVEVLGTLSRQATVHHMSKVERFRQLLQQHGDLGALEGLLA